MQSEQINELAAALAVAQGKITGALKDSANPFFKSKYADLASVWDACREALSANGLAVVQTTEADKTGIVLTTTLMHKSGQFISGTLAMQGKDDSPQAMGSAMTYARRYALAAIVGVAQVDDDANAATHGKTFGDRSGKPDTSGVDPELKEQYSQGFANALLRADDAKIMELHDELKTQAELYQAVSDTLSSKQRTDLRAVISAAKKAAA